MANQNLPGSYVPKGVNESNTFVVKAVIPTAMVAADTVTLALPAGVDPRSLPASVLVFGPPAGGVLTPDPDLALTSHNASAGTTLLTAAGNIAAGSTILAQYVQNDQS